MKMLQNECCRCQAHIQSPVGFIPAFHPDAGPQYIQNSMQDLENAGLGNFRIVEKLKVFYKVSKIGGIWNFLPGVQCHI